MGAFRLLLNWVGGHMSVRLLPYLEGRCKNRSTCHRRAMTGPSRSHVCAVKELSLTLSFVTLNDATAGPEVEKARQPQTSQFKISVFDSIRTADVSLSKIACL